MGMSNISCIRRLKPDNNIAAIIHQNISTISIIFSNSYSASISSTASTILQNKTASLGNLPTSAASCSTSGNENTLSSNEENKNFDVLPKTIIRQNLKEKGDVFQQQQPTSSALNFMSTLNARQESNNNNIAVVNDGNNAFETNSLLCLVPGNRKAESSPSLVEHATVGDFNYRHDLKLQDVQAKDGKGNKNQNKVARLKNGNCYLPFIART